MTFKKNRPASPPKSTPDIGVHVYDREKVQDIDYDAAACDILTEAVHVFSFNNKRRDDFNFSPTNIYPRKGPFEFVLPEGMDPQGPVLQLAKAGVGTPGYGFGLVASVESSKSIISNRSTDLAIERLKDLNKTDALGFVFLVERSENVFNPRLERLRESMGQLTVPTMTVITLAALETVPIEQGPQETDPGPGLSTLG